MAASVENVELNGVTRLALRSVTPETDTLTVLPVGNAAGNSDRVSRSGESTRAKEIAAPPFSARETPMAVSASPLIASENRIRIGCVPPIFCPCCGSTAITTGRVVSFGSLAIAVSSGLTGDAVEFTVRTVLAVARFPAASEASTCKASRAAFFTLMSYSLRVTPSAGAAVGPANSEISTSPSAKVTPSVSATERGELSESGRTQSKRLTVQGELSSTKITSTRNV